MPKPYQFSLSEDDCSILMSLTLGVSEIETETIVSVLNKKYPEYIADTEAIEQFIEQNTAHPEGETATIVSIVGRGRSHELAVEVSDDAMQATLEVTVGCSSIELTEAEIRSALESQEVTVGIQQEAIDGLITQVNRAKSSEVVSSVIAEGVEPVMGEATQFEQIAATLSDRGNTPIDREDGSVDMYNFGDIELLEVGAELMRRIPETPGINGSTVTNLCIPAESGEAKPFRVYDGSAIAEADENLLVATIKGVAENHGNGMSVSHLLTLPGVNHTTGNIQFDGDIIVTGDVTEGLSIIATGNVVVEGAVEHAQITAGGDVRIGRGLLGTPFRDNASDIAQMQLETWVHSKGDVFIRFAQFAEILADKAVHVDELLLHCFVRSGDSIYCGEMGSGKVIGGILHTAKGLQAKDLGAPAMVKTQVFIKQVSDEDIDAIKMSLNEQTEKLDELKLLFLKLASMDKDHPIREQLPNVVKTYEAKSYAFDELAQQYDYMVTELNSQEDMGVTAEQVIYPGVSVKIANKTYEVNSAVKAGTICFRRGRIVLE